MKISRNTRRLWRWGAFVVLGIVLVSWYVFDRLSCSDIGQEQGIPESIAGEEGGKEAGSESGEAESSEEEALYPVVHVYDGDTFTVRMPDGSIETVRLLGIDAPETGKKYTKRECYGDESTAALVGLIGGKSVRLVSDPSQDDRDAYDRLLRYVTLPDGTDAGLRMIEEGFVREYTFHGRVFERQANYLAAEGRAREAEKGLWDACEGAEI
jgi:endonuclease YncB( thermonuclease family)